MGSLTRRALLVGAGAVAGGTAVALAPLGRRSVGSVLPPASPDDGTMLNDASELNPVRVARHIVVEQDVDEALVAAIRKEIVEAAAAGQPVAAAGAGHSMGGQSLPVDGTAVTFDQSWLELDTAASTYRVAAGNRWRGVIAQLDPHGFSPAVMQSNNDFGVASTFCVNAHGWPVPHGPFGSTVRSFRMVMADGELVECSREVNRELFELAMGGYGLVGALVDLVVEMVPNRLLEPHFERIDSKDFAPRFATATDEGARVNMAYGRLDMALDGFMGEGLMGTYTEVADAGELPAVSGSGVVSQLSRLIYRAQTGSDLFKGLRWWMETDIAPALRGKTTRNSLMNEPVATLADNDPGRSDILHEYFVPPERFADFVAACREVIPSSYQELLNVTLRFVKADSESMLCYAPGDRIAAVMAFSQEKSVRAEEDMRRLTRALIDRVIELGGAYYLPYRLHATRRQMGKVYPRLEEFVERKLAADPRRVFRNAMWDRYMDPSAPGDEA